MDAFPRVYLDPKFNSNNTRGFPLEMYKTLRENTRRTGDFDRHIQLNKQLKKHSLPDIFQNLAAERLRWDLVCVCLGFLLNSKHQNLLD
jgi:hypothetical protein